MRILIPTTVQLIRLTENVSLHCTIPELQKKKPKKTNYRDQNWGLPSSKEEKTNSGSVSQAPFKAECQCQSPGWKNRRESLAA